MSLDRVGDPREAPRQEDAHLHGRRPAPASPRLPWRQRPRAAWRWWWNARWRRALSWTLLALAALWQVGVLWMLQDPRFQRISEEGWRRMDWRELRLVWALQDTALSNAVTDGLRRSGVVPTPPPAGLAALATAWGAAIRERHAYLFLDQTVDQSGILYVIVNEETWADLPSDDRLLVTAELGLGWRRYLEEHLKRPVEGEGAPGVIVLDSQGTMLARDLDGTIALVGPKPARDTSPP